jgi:hypothetical protein
MVAQAPVTYNVDVRDNDEQNFGIVEAVAMKCSVCEDEPSIAAAAAVPGVAMSVQYGERCMRANAHPENLWPHAPSSKSLSAAAAASASATLPLALHEDKINSDHADLALMLHQPDEKLR